MASSTPNAKTLLVFLFILGSITLLYQHFAISENYITIPRLRGTDARFKHVFIPDPAQYVRPFIGTIAGGHVFPGATLPHGMVKLGMDTNSPENHAGYDANGKYDVLGFSHLHDDGTGGSIPLSNFKLFPIAECPSFSECVVNIRQRAIPRVILPDGRPDDFASPGYFSTNLSNSVRVELTATRRTGLHRYTFPAGVDQPRIAIDITNDGQKSGTGAALTIDPLNAIVSGEANFQGSFGSGQFRGYACVTFKGDGYQLGEPSEFGVWTATSPTLMTNTSIQTVNAYTSLGAIFTFQPSPGNRTTSILARVGVSLISSTQACSNAEEEIPEYDFEGVHTSARSQWNDLLSRVQVSRTGVSEETLEVFYSSLYRSHIAPADYTGENPLWNSTEPYYDSFYCNWDTYRTLYPLMSLHDPIIFSRIVRAMLDIQKNEGWLPECRGATVKHFIQGGSSSDPILAEFFVKFSEYAKQLNVPAHDLYEALVVDAEEQPAQWMYQGRQADIYNKFGYLPIDHQDPGGMNTRHVSRALEYAFDDFAISQVAKLLGKTEDAEKYSKRAGNFANVWDPSVSVPDFPSVAGMMQQRRMNGSFVYTDPRHCSDHDPDHSACFLDGGNMDGFYEGSPLIYSQYAPQDTAKLIELQGGNEKFISRLDFIFEQGYFQSTNEPSHHMPFMYHYANRPGLSTQRSRQVLHDSFSNKVDGLPGNDDSGAMGSYATFLLAGLYPLPATRQFLLSSPSFREIAFYNPLLKTTTTIINKGFQGNPPNGTGGHVFVKSVAVNGKQYKSNCYLDWDVFTTGSTVELTLTDDINVTCGFGKDALPPSLSTGGYD